MRAANLVFVKSAFDEHRKAILDRLIDFNASRAAPSEAAPLCIAVLDDKGTPQGGLYGTTLYDWLAIELLFVPEAMRGSGLGTQLIAKAEDEARGRGCIGAWLNTFDFQARGFYERLGYQVAGAIPDHPRGGTRYFMMKRWTDAP